MILHPQQYFSITIKRSACMCMCVVNFDRRYLFYGPHKVTEKDRGSSSGAPVGVCKPPQVNRVERRGLDCKEGQNPYSTRPRPSNNSPVTTSPFSWLDPWSPGSKIRCWTSLLVVTLGNKPPWTIHRWQTYKDSRGCRGQISPPRTRMSSRGSNGSVYYNHGRTRLQVRKGVF